ncbi:Diaminopimelate epimerase [Peptoniphilus asaccharolyticus DSM 20463]|uniref:Diaminopimelate epimerase n=1 Tax=Peptoniphilus asaccharolyticus DSM 20463 TaxID=573058 RepID=A0A1W1VKE0_PEPAS|nr:hypothetical protein [Peptoniphilus asaccharolyticus]MBL7574450.1 hypothetical protein [Peptoniphilus asaccharolyticus]SMB93786.1 Diaminopimelate epimerase [Peptoniphilus asaccharolyticus DSM 20463]
MKKSFEYFRANPAGNITGYVITPVYPGYRRAYAKEIIKRDPSVEQVGFISPSYDGAPLRMDMMGGEFCGNATRAYGLYSASFYESEGDVLIEVYVSGVEGPTNVIVNQQEKTAYVKVEKPERIIDVKVDDKEFKAVVLSGIVHLIAKDVEEDSEFVEKALKVLKDEVETEAYGVIFLDTDKKEIIPYVNVPSAETLVREGSCASGSISATYILNEDEDPDFETVIKNPNGELEVFADFTNGIEYVIGGPVELGEIEKVTIDIPAEEVKRVKIEHQKEIETINKVEEE